MIKTFGNEETERTWNGERSKKLPVEIQQIARRKLRMINNSHSIVDLRVPPANRLEKLGGDLKGFYSIRVNKQWRIILRWVSGHAENVQIIDYH